VVGEIPQNGTEYTQVINRVSCVTSQDQLADTVQRLGLRISGALIVGGIYPRFGTRNFTLTLENNQYMDIVCPGDNPATELTPWESQSKRMQWEKDVGLPGFLAPVTQKNFGKIFERRNRRSLDASRRHGSILE
jgi:hypothetical protein